MAGIYIHIPFCKQACHYCDFHFSTNLTRRSEMTQAICHELRKRSDYLDERIDSIYFGGGTPSLLNPEELKAFMSTLSGSFEINPSAEITLEANPEDLNVIKLESLQKIGVNRLSIGIQTFKDSKLKWMNRIHSSEQAKLAFKNARTVEFENISVDLIYALPGNEIGDWLEDLRKSADLGPEHISIYGLTIEDRTVFGHRKNKGELIEVVEEEAASQYLKTIESLKSFGYQQYEVSNFSKPGFESFHNSSYWAGKNYLGVGPGAHSYNGSTRQFNVRNNSLYLKAITNGSSYFETEKLSQTQLVNERILTNLRTIAGLDLTKLETDFGIDLFEEHQSPIELLQDQKLLEIEGEKLHLTSKGFLVADEIALKLFFDE